MSAQGHRFSVARRGLEAEPDTAILGKQKAINVFREWAIQRLRCDFHAIFCGLPCRLRARDGIARGQWLELLEIAI